MKITEQELAVRKKRIIYTAYELFCERGIDSVPLKEVAEKSEVSLNSIFRYFDSKASLLHCTQNILWEEITSQILNGSKSKLVSSANGFEEMEILLSNFQALYEQHSSYLLFACDYKLFLVRQHIQLSEQSYKEMLRPVYRAFTAALSRGQEDGSIARDETVETQFFVLWGVMRGFVEEIVVYDRIYGGENFWKAYFTLVCRHALERLRA